MKNIKTLRTRGLRGQARAIDPQRQRRNARLQSDQDFGDELYTDEHGRLRVDADELGLPSSSRVEALESEITTMKAALKAAGLL